jgi:hypothetical protein
MDRVTLEKEHPELFAEVKALGVAEAKAGFEAQATLLRTEVQAETLQVERARMEKIISTASGLKEGLLLQVCKNGTSVEDAFALMLANQAQFKSETLAALNGAAPPPLGTDPIQDESHEGASINSPEAQEKAAKAEWEKDPKLKADFPEFKNFLIYWQHKQAGQIKETGH